MRLNTKALKKKPAPASVKKRKVPPPPAKTKVTRLAYRSRTKKRTVERNRTAWELYLADWSQKQIAEHLGLSQGRVSSLLNATMEEHKQSIAGMAQMELAKELERTRAYAHANNDTALHDPRTADTLLKWLERKDKLLGLYVNKTELSGPNGGMIRTGNVDIDISKLELKHLEWLEEIYRIAGPDSPARESGQTYAQQAQLTKEAVATADSSTHAERTEESLSEEANAEMAL